MQVDVEELRTRVEEMFGQISQFRQQSKNIEQSLEAFFHGLQGAIAGMPGAGGSHESEGLKKKKGKSKTPVLDYFTDDLIVKSKDNKIDPVIGRDREIERVIHIL